MKKSYPFFNLKKSFLLVCTLLLVSMFGFSQTNYTITFQDETLEVEENIQTFEWSQMPDYSRLGNGYFGWVQFYETPTQAIQDAFERNNLQLLNYIPHRTYLFYFPENTSVAFLRNSGVRAIVPVEGRFKMSQDLKNANIGDWAWDGDNILVTLVHHDNVSRDYVLSELASHQIQVTNTYDNSNFLELSIPNNCLDDLSRSAYVKWIELITPPSIPDDDRGRGLHRANWIDTQTGTGLNYDGTGVGVMCRDDGPVGPHIDFEGRQSGLNGNNGTNTHGDGVSGIMAGAGNRNPTKRGMAAGSDLLVIFYNPTFLDNPTVSSITNGDTQITNSSYSNGCNDGYTTAAVTVDTQINTTPSLLHVFSAGNSNGSNCGYGAGTQWGNITGGHKQAKNSIATANTFFTGDLVSSSSRGPATDGRIKPDIAANGQQSSTAPNHNYLNFGGTSGAAPGIAGVSAQLYQIYMEENGGNLPNSALIKAALLNTANEAGNVGPDFKFGWGIVNAGRAGQLLLDERYLSDNVTQGNTNSHTINVPSGTTQVRFMVYWKDPTAAPGANPTLVNDLDMLVTDPSSSTIQPWVLDSTPNATALDTPAAPGVDHLNNMEQVLINNPSAGNYTVNVSGFNVPQGPQEYFVVYEIIQDNITVTYPNGGEKLFKQGGINPIIHWDAINDNGPFTLEYTPDNGATWNTIGTTSLNYWSWTMPDGLYSGDVKVRVSSGSASDESNDTFNVVDSIVTTFAITNVCDTEATFSWIEVPEAESYDLYILGEKYMELVGNSTGESITIPITDPEAEVWYSVAPRNDSEGWVGERANAKFYAGGILDCELGIEEVALERNLSIYPNPASDFISVELKNSQVITEVSLLNNLGQVMTSVSNNGSTSKMNIDVSGMATGLYFVKVNTENASVTKKLIVK